MRRRNRLGLVVLLLVCFGAAITLYNVITPEMPSESGIIESRIPANDFVQIKNQIDEQIRRTTSSFEEIPDYLRVHYKYDITGKESLLNMFSYFYANGVELPLFKDRLTPDTPPGIPDPEICVSVVTTRRPQSPFSYLLQTVSALLNRMNYQNYKNMVYIHVFNVDPEPEEHKEVDIVRKLLPVTDIKVPLEAPEGLPLQPHYHENMDTAAIVRLVDRMGCKYPIFLEDDALATTDWVVSVLDAIRDLKQRPSDSWFMVRLFVARSFYSPLRNRGINHYDPGFNNVAVIINKNSLGGFADALEEVVKRTLRERNHDLHRPKDHIAVNYAKEHGLSILAYEPVIFQHTGLYSSVSKRVVNKELVNNWIMHSKYFEADNLPILFDPEQWFTTTHVIP